MKKTKKAIALVLAGALMSGCFVGCDLVTKDSRKDLAQVVATVDITRNSEFGEGGNYADYKDVISESEILKRDMIAYYQDVGYSYQNSYGWSYAETFEWISESLTILQLDVQYAMTYFLANKTDGCTKEGYTAAVSDKSDELAGLKYFLSQEEQDRALYTTRRLFNNTLDSVEPQYIKSNSKDSSTVEVRTLPTGVDTTNSDYYDVDYKVYTGKNKPEDCASYEALEGSTATSRKNAYNDFLASLRRNDLLEDGENTNDIESLSYFRYKLKSSYESAIISKLGEEFEKKAEANITEQDMADYYNDIYAKQEAGFAADKASFESSLDSVSNSTFLLTAPEENYGYVINILLPFSALQSAQVQNLKPDANDAKGNSFIQRASILEKLTATDQRASWFTGEEDYSYQGTGYTGGNSNRQYLFFEDSLNAGENSKNELLKNYLGKYTYNGSVYKKDDGTYALAPNKITIDQFIGEMEGYLASEGFGFEYKKDNSKGYYAQTDYYKEEDKSVVDYSKFVYYAGKVKFDNYDANNLFVADSNENKAFSIINELSFAYNTDTAGLNSYLGYSIVTGKTNFVSEFEYAAQQACKEGAGTYYVVPSDYGWHIIYCTFSFKENSEGKIRPFTFDYNDREKEGTFSYYFYESIKADLVSDYSSNRQKMIANAYNDCKTVNEKAYQDLLDLD